MEDLLQQSACRLAELIRARQLSPIELTEAALARIDALQPRINAFITVTADSARAAARDAEAAVMRGGPLGPFHGVPFSVKDLTYTRGVRTTMGSPIFASFVPNEDAPAVARLKDAGAILIGKTTTPEFGHKPFTDGPLFGTTRNPWNPAHTSGGSSGGAAAAVASLQSPIALGSDGGGSIRIPASCCGVVGLKATLGRIPHVHVPDLFGTNSYIGPIARNVADTRAVLAVLSGPDRRDPYGLAGMPHDAPKRPAGIAGLRIAWMARVGNREVDPAVLSACEHAVKALEQAGARIEPMEMDFVALEHAFLVMLQSALLARLERFLPEFGDKIDASLLKTIERGRQWSAKDLQHAAVARSDLFRRLQALFDRVDLIVTPTLSAPAPSVDQRAFAPFFVNGKEIGPVRGAWYPYTYPFNLSGHPALSVPCGLSPDGLPIGLQLVGPWHADAALLDVAEAVEAATPAMRCP